ncbi:hypothetical protein E2C01_058470 [Portunus trituberculatus]|uniref:Uncharacterized protein n=1 Tax=Portunus trituberculatus TaxID=210409 RepID=A0A5B7H395_PORTR|nr:hypothetical protein [Portunus trituberculatus]
MPTTEETKDSPRTEQVRSKRSARRNSFPQILPPIQIKAKIFSWPETSRQRFPSTGDLQGTRTTAPQHHGNRAA